MAEELPGGALPLPVLLDESLERAQELVAVIPLAVFERAQQVVAVKAQRVLVL